MGDDSTGGEFDQGVIFKTDLNGDNMQVQYQLQKIDGHTPQLEKLIQYTNGKFYGMTSNGGTYNLGVIYEFDPINNIYNKMLDFDGSNGSQPNGSLMQTADGKVFGMTRFGGANSLGVLFEFDPVTNTYTKKLDFDGTNKGSQPYGTLVEASSGIIYGMTSYGGSSNYGVLFEYDTENDSYTKRLDFDGSAKGQYPKGSLIEASNGKLYGATTSGGTNSVGVLFEYDPLNNTFTKKLNFDGATKGSFPYGSLVEAPNGFLYGMTVSGGGVNLGVLYEYDPANNTFSKIFDFNGSSKGQNPYGSLAVALNGKLYGMTLAGGSSNYGVLFEFDPTTQNFSKKVDFDGSNTGRSPNGTLCLSSNGNLYGVTGYGGASDHGVFFEYDVYNDSYYRIFNFDAGPEGKSPLGSLNQAKNGKIYGMSSNGGSSNFGVLFEFDPSVNQYSLLLEFEGSNNGKWPYGSLIQATNGKLYGMTSNGGSTNFGVLFEFDPANNTYSKMIDFNGTSNGSYPRGRLVEGSDGELYGLTSSGGSSNFGVLFKYNSTNQSFTKLVDFDGSNKGQNPYGSPCLASNGKIYGVTYRGGGANYGVLFEYDPSSNIFTNKISFLNFGRYPYEGLTEATNGKLYGMTNQGGSSNYGVLFEYDPATSTYTKKLDFDGTNKGSYPRGSLMQASNGKLYGMTFQGGTSNLGVLFEYDPETDTFTKKLDFDGTNNGSSPQYTQLVEINYNEYTWSGATSSDWENTANWSESRVPVGTNSVVIPAGLSNYPSLTNAAFVDDLTMESNTSLKGQENLTINGNLTIERQITGYSSASDGWHFISSPVSNQTIAGSGFVPVPNVDDLYKWGEASGEWLNYTGGSFGDAQFEVGKGYLVAYDNTSTKEFSGDFNTSSVAKNLSYTAGMGDGWNLLGNPYPSAIDWDLITRSGDVDNAAYIVNPTDGSYKSWVNGLGDISNGEIPANQGFFVKANSGGQSVTMDLADQLHSTNAFNKSTTTLPANSIKISLTGAGSENNTYLRFDANATPTFDSDADAYKLFGFAVIPQVYTQLGETDYSINSVSFPTEIMSIPLGIYLNQDADLSFDISGIEGLNTSLRIELEDKAENKLVNLREQNSYTFLGTTNDEADRFLIHCSQATGVETNEAQDAQVYASGGRVYIRMEEGAQYSEMSIYDVAGRLINTRNITSQSLQSFDFSQLTGVYLVQLKGESTSVTKKITL